MVAFFNPGLSISEMFNFSKYAKQWSSFPNIKLENGKISKFEIQIGLLEKQLTNSHLNYRSKALVIWDRYYGTHFLPHWLHVLSRSEIDIFILLLLLYIQSSLIQHVHIMCYLDSGATQENWTERKDNIIFCTLYLNVVLQV